MAEKYTLEDVEAVLKTQYWSVLAMVVPIGKRLILFFCNHTNITPNQLTITSFLLGLIASLCFLQGYYFYLILGVIFFWLSLLFDLTDGGVARLKRMESGFGAYLDLVLDKCRIFFLLLCLIYGQYLLTKDISYFFLGFTYLFADLMYILNMQILRISNPAYGNSIMENYLKIGRWKIKPYLGSKKVVALPCSDVDAEVLIFVISPLLYPILSISIKLGLLIGSIIVLMTLLGISIFFFLSSRSKIKGGKDI